jgi:hypothetical protein
MPNIKDNTPRNNAFFDKWSIVHLFSAAALTLIFGASWAFVITVLWEPLELFYFIAYFSEAGHTLWPRNYTQFFKRHSIRRNWSRYRDYRTAIILNILCYNSSVIESSRDGGMVAILCTA